MLKGRFGRATLTALTGCIATLLLAAGAQADTVTVGPTLGGPESPVPCFESTGCAVAMPSASVSSEATVSPISGTVVSWSIQGAAAVPGYNVVVLRKNPIGTYAVTAASPLVTPSE
jgi:hypothetical protein